MIQFILLFQMPSPRKRGTSAKKKLTVKVATTTPSRIRSARIKANEVKKEEEDDKPTVSRRSVSKKSLSPRGY